MKTKCSACKKNKLWFLVRKRSYSGKNVPTGRVISDTAICKRCHENAKMLILGQWSMRHYAGYIRMRLTNTFHEIFTAAKSKQAHIQTPESK